MYLDPQNDDLKTSYQIWFNEYTLFKVNWECSNVKLGC